VNFRSSVNEDRAVAQLYGMIHPEALETAAVRTVVVIDPDKKVKLTLTYPAAIGRDVDEIVQALHALPALRSAWGVDPGQLDNGDDVIISPAISDDDSATRFSKGFTTLKPYLRLTPEQNR
jgi:alkyl hydroperoxide reductase subunit AhpC